MQDLIDTNKKDNYELKKILTKHDSEFTKIKKILKQMMVQNQHSSPYNMDSPKSQDTGSVLPANNMDPPLEGGNLMKMVVCRLLNIR